MLYPTLREETTDRQMVDVFSGYNHNLRIGDGEFYDMKNMTSSDYPVLSSRCARGKYTLGDPTKPVAMIEKDTLCFVDGKDFFCNGTRITDLDLEEETEERKKQLVSMGAYVIIMPDKKYINTANLEDRGDIEAVFESSEPVTFSMCRENGEGYGDVQAGNEAPKEPNDGEMWVDTSSSPNSLKMWSASSGMWVGIASVYVKISCAGIDKKFNVYDGVELSGLTGQLDMGNDDKYEVEELAALEGAAVVWGKGDDYIVVVGVLSTMRTVHSKITVSRLMPEMDYVIECGNRLWGCKYGQARNGQVVNELYGSKLGDFKNWNCSMGISTDSWAVPVGTDGAFTGAFSYLGYPVFFKENHLHKIYISSTAAHQATDTPCNGVQKGCSRSLAMVGNTLYYKSRNGVCAYDGSLPTEISQALGNVSYFNAVSGGIGNKYYISMADADNAYNLFVYDAGKGMWHREDALQVDYFAKCRNELYAIADDQILAMLGGDESFENTVEWMVETGLIGLNTPDMKYISKLILRMQLPQGSFMRVSAEYDSSGRWVQLFDIRGQGMRAFTLPIKPVRCDHIRLRLEGDGQVKLFSITKIIEQGSDVR